jgi:hypothetical protein
MSCYTWSNFDTKFNRLCTNQLMAEAANTTETCEVCVHPVQVGTAFVDKVTGENGCVSWSQQDVHFSGLCRNKLTSDSTTTFDHKNCSVCVAPQATGTGSIPGCTGYSSWIWDEFSGIWVLASNECSVGCSPVAPDFPGSPGQVAISGCE